MFLKGRGEDKYKGPVSNNISKRKLLEHAKEVCTKCKVVPPNVSSYTRSAVTLSLKIIQKI